VPSVTALLEDRGEELISPVRAAELLKCSLGEVEREIRGPLDR